jgi:hypothetical protein
MAYNDDMLKLLDMIKDATKRSLRYGRVASFLSALEIVLFASSAAIAVTYLLLYAYWQLVAIGMALATMAFVTDRLCNRYYRKMFEEVDRMEMLSYILALTVDVDKAKAMLQEKLDELKQELKKRQSA